MTDLFSQFESSDYKCQECKDTGWIKLPQGGGKFCDHGKQTKAIVSEPHSAFKITLEPTEYQIAALIYERNSTNPIKIREIQKTLEFNSDSARRLDERQVRAVCRKLREKGLRIGSSQGPTENNPDNPPAGYYYIHNQADFISYYNSRVTQAVSEFRLVRMMLKRDFPELAGQLKIDWTKLENESDAA